MCYTTSSTCEGIPVPTLSTSHCCYELDGESYTIHGSYCYECHKEQDCQIKIKYRT